MKFSFLFLTASVVSASVCDENQLKDVPTLCKMLDANESDPATLADELASSELSIIMDEFHLAEEDKKAVDGSSLPIVVAHGMGDSCFNRGMESITKSAGEKVGAYSVCIPTGDSRISDTINGFLLNMDASVDVFAEAVRADPALANGFNAFGLSQGNNLIRGYIQKYNDPPVNTFMSINGINAGVGAFPSCSPQAKHIGGICQLLTEVLGDFAYNTFVQKHLFQANYFRDPSKTDGDRYKKYSQLAQWENEGDDVDPTRNENFAKTNKFIWVLGTEDTVVWPREGEQWGAMDPADPFNTLLAWNETKWYTEDTFGLRTADEAGKHNFESFEGDHLQFTNDELMGWLEKYFM